MNFWHYRDTKKPLPPTPNSPQKIAALDVVNTPLSAAEAQQGVFGFPLFEVSAKTEGFYFLVLPRSTDTPKRNSPLEPLQRKEANIIGYSNNISILLVTVTKMNEGVGFEKKAVLLHISGGVKHKNFIGF